MLAGVRKPGRVLVDQCVEFRNERLQFPGLVIGDVALGSGANGGERCPEIAQGTQAEAELHQRRERESGAEQGERAKQGDHRLAQWLLDDPARADRCDRHRAARRDDVHVARVQPLAAPIARFARVDLMVFMPAGAGWKRALVISS
ncbi:hypothetical protein NHF48_018935 [Sphingomonas sp. H160509]|uniref:hypothetical protein n=1 Tax=Sphingomonas sp. H160509 TaxID=2955313 RepID=UPI002096D2FE|nr:hypothetical protein [Sphingomonas sp. H160509]MDD1452533.1 hypothetical protein [Sphingomonas sp. H160509]